MVEIRKVSHWALRTGNRNPLDLFLKRTQSQLDTIELQYIVPFDNRRPSVL